MSKQMKLHVHIWIEKPYPLHLDCSEWATWQGWRYETCDLCKASRMVDGNGVEVWRVEGDGNA